MRVFNTDWDATFGYTVQRDRSWLSFAALWGGFALAPILQGLVGGALMQVYSQPRRWQRGCGRDYRHVPMYVAGLTLVLLPGFCCLGLLSLSAADGGRAAIAGYSD